MTPTILTCNKARAPAVMSMNLLVLKDEEAIQIVLKEFGEDTVRHDYRVDADTEDTIGTTHISVIVGKSLPMLALAVHFHRWVLQYPFLVACSDGAGPLRPFPSMEAAHDIGMWFPQMQDFWCGKWCTQKYKDATHQLKVMDEAQVDADINRSMEDLIRKLNDC